ncbi:winged helix-turn-helix domain-containing protein [Parasalinivibrio latis]|uniref:winged helix-turn-helix domain-containing protein n=1 Tax=Parasalinivibrio latis TaxID=2952610 RepID=UPI0030E2F311
MNEKQPPHIVVVDDEEDIRDVLEDILVQQGYRVTSLSSSTGLQDCLPADIVVLDLRLNGEDGLQIARNLRHNSDMPIMMLTGKGDETDRIVGLEVAADDYMMKPFNLREFTARINALLRRRPQEKVKITPDEILYRFDSWELNTTRRELRGENNKPISLTYGEFSLLEALITAPRRVLSREQLMEKTHGYDSDSLDRTIDVLVLRLRRKIERNPKLPSLIKTERGIGYVLDCDVHRVEGR